MNYYASELIVTVIDDSGPRPLMALYRPLRFMSATLGEVVVPEGYEFDGASIPQAAMSLTGWPGVRAACVHDWLVDSPHVSRETADAVFREALRASGVPDAVAAAMFAAVALRTARLHSYPSTEGVHDGA